MNPSDKELRDWFDKKGLLPLQAPVTFDYERWHQSRNDIHWKMSTPHRSPGWWALGVAVLAGLIVWAPWHLVASKTALPVVSVRKPKLPVPKLNLGIASELGDFAFTNATGLWMTTPTGSLVHVSSNTSATNPLWSSDGQYLAYQTSGLYGANPVLHIYNRIAKTAVLSVSAVSYQWQPGHDIIAVVQNSALRLITLHGNVASTEKLFSGTVDGSAIWSPNGTYLAYSLTEGTLGQRHDVATEVTATATGFGTPKPLFNAPKGDGIWLAAFVPRSHNILYWIDEGYSLSIMADGAPLDLWNATTGHVIKLPFMLPYRNYLTLGGGHPWGFMAGGPRVISGGKSVVLINHQQVRRLTTPKGIEAIEPALNPYTQEVAAVLAQNNENAAWNLLTAYHHWVKTRQLAVWENGTWHIWSNAGPGVTDPVWAPKGQGIFYLANNWLWEISSARGKPIPLIGPIPSTGGYYGEVLRSSLWSLGRS
ncbi:MAG: hypothetical protein M1499_04220 [Firmicutes bacterium]|nr:hypothetical protein [Bacillota bacterium]